MRLKPCLDAARLQEELRVAESRLWRAEEPYRFEGFFGSETKVYHDGKWVGVSLRSQGGSPDRTDPGGPGLEDFRDTTLVKHTPYISEVLASLRAPLRSARLLRLPPGGVIGVHRDTYHGLEYGQLRLHAPITTNESVENVIRGQEWHWRPGELWYGDFGSLHHVRNNGSVDRVHLVVDVAITPALLTLFPNEFASQIRCADILFHEAPAAVEPEELGRLQCCFRLPSTLVRGIFDIDDGIVAELDAELTLRGDRLLLRVEDRDLFRLIPLSGRRLALVGWTMERYLEYRTDGRRVVALALVLRRGRQETQISFHVSSR